MSDPGCLQPLRAAAGGRSLRGGGGNLHGLDRAGSARLRIADRKLDGHHLRKVGGGLGSARAVPRRALRRDAGACRIVEGGLPRSLRDACRSGHALRPQRGRAHHRHSRHEERGGGRHERCLFGRRRLSSRAEGETRATRLAAEFLQMSGTAAGRRAPCFRRSRGRNGSAKEAPLAKIARMVPGPRHREARPHSAGPRGCHRAAPETHGVAARCWQRALADVVARHVPVAERPDAGADGVGGQVRPSGKGNPPRPRRHGCVSICTR
jgi:hypothetical protein